MIRALAHQLAATFAALVTLAVLAGVASATVTASTITSVKEGTTTLGNPLYYMYNSNAGSQPNFTVAGTTNGTTGDNVDIDCFYNEDGAKTNQKTLAASVAVNASGTFSDTITLPSLDWACHLVAVPSGATLASLDVSPFKGPTVGASWESTTQDGSGHTYDYESDLSGRDIWSEVKSPSAGGLCLSYPTGADQTSNYSTYSAWGNYKDTVCTGAAALYGNDGASRSDVQVDGHNGYLSYWASTGGTGNTLNQLYSGSETSANRADVTVTRSLNSTTGNATITDTENIVECQTSPDPYPATNADCGGTKASGLQLQRTTRTSSNGEQVTVSDKYSSVDGKSHKLDVEYDNDTQEFSQYYTEWKLPGSDDFTYESQGAAVSLGSGSLGTFDVESGSAGYMDPFYNVPAAITYTTEPNSARFIYQPVNSPYAACDGSPGYPACDLVLDYQRTVPAGGSVTIMQVFTVAPSQITVNSLTALTEDALVTPVVKITRPVNGSKTSSSRVTVVGTAHDLHGLRSLTVDGIPVVTDASGNWSIPLNLVSGANTITARATNLAGRTALALDHVRYVPPKAKRT